MLLSAVNFDTNMLIGLAVDVLVVALLLLFAVVGAKKGIIKMSFGLITMVAVFLGSLLLVSPVSKVLINNTNLDNQLMSALERPIGTKLPGSYSFVYYHDLDNDPETPDELVIDKDNIPMPYDYVFEGTIYQQFGLHKLMRPMVENTLKNGDSDRIYLVDAITFSIASIIIMAATFIVLIIVLRIIMAILMRLLKKAVASLYIAHFLDRFFGLIFGLALGAVFILAAITLIQVFQNASFMEPVITALNRSYLTKFVMDNNFVYAYIVDKIDFRSILSKLFPGNQA